MAEQKDWYCVLGIKKDATEKEIKSNFRRLAKKYHPDTHPKDPECEKIFRDINEAYRILGDEEKRKKYDKEREQAYFQEKDSRKGKSGEHHKDSHKTGTEDIDFQNIHKSFEQFFGFHPQTKDVTNEDKLKSKSEASKNPLDTSELFEKFMGIKR